MGSKFKISHVKVDRQSLGFSMLELLVVVSVIAILGVLATNSYIRFGAKAKQVEAQVLLRSVMSLAATSDNNLWGSGMVSCTTNPSSCSVSEERQLRDAGLTVTSDRWTLKTEDPLYYFHIGICGPYGDCMIARPIDLERILPGCTGDTWIIPEGGENIVGLSSCLD